MRRASLGESAGLETYSLHTASPDAQADACFSRTSDSRVPRKKAATNAVPNLPLVHGSHDPLGYGA